MNENISVYPDISFETTTHAILTQFNNDPGFSILVVPLFITNIMYLLY